MSNVRSLERAKKGEPTMSTHVGAVLHVTQVTRSILSMPAVESQSVEGAPRRRAAPGSQFVKVAAQAATSGHRRNARTTQPSLQTGRATSSQLEAEHSPVPTQRSGRHPRPCAKAQRLLTSRASTGVGASAHARHASATHCCVTTRPALFAPEHNGRVRSKYSAQCVPPAGT